MLSTRNIKLTGLKPLMAFLQRTIIVAAVKKSVEKGDFLVLFGVEKETMAELLWESITVARELWKQSRRLGGELEVKAGDYYV